MRCVSIVALLMAEALHAAPALQVRIMLERVDHSLVTVSPRHEFHSGDRIHLRVSLSEPADVYVLNKTRADFSIDPAALRAARTGDVETISGLPHIVFGPVRLTAGETDLAAVSFDESAGIEKLLVVAASRPSEPPTVIEMDLRHAN